MSPGLNLHLQDMMSLHTVLRPLLKEAHNNSRTADVSLALLNYLPFILQKHTVALARFVTK